MSTLPNPFDFAGCVEHIPASSAVASLPPAFQVDATAEFPRGFDPVQFYEAISAPAVCA